MNTLRVLRARVGFPPVVEEIPNNIDGLRAAIGGGRLEYVALTTDYGIYCDEEGELKKLAPSFIIPYKKIVIRGDFIIVKNIQGQEVSLTQEDVRKVFNLNLL